MVWYVYLQRHPLKYIKNFDLVLGVIADSEEGAKKIIQEHPAFNPDRDCIMSVVPVPGYTGPFVLDQIQTTNGGG